MNIKQIKELIQKITKHFHYDDYIINILTICYIAIVSVDQDVSDILEEVLSTKYILENDGSFNRFLNKYYPDIDIFCDTYYEPSFNSENCNADDFIVLAIFEHFDICDIIEGFIHELKHAMNSIIKRYDKGIFRCGLCEITNFNKERIFRYELIEEAFNSFLTKIYLKQILKLKKLKIEDPGIRRLLKDFKIENYVYSYDKITSLLEPLFCDSELFRLFYNAALYKDYEPLYTKLESIFCTDLDTIDMMVEDCYYGYNESIKDYIEPNYHSTRIRIRISDITKTIS